MKQHRIPGTTSTPTWSLEIACGIDPAGALVRALEDAPVGAGEIWDIAVHHDAGCPATNGSSMPACTCELVRLDAARLR